jgi:RNA recognition motif-containing protein
MTRLFLTNIPYDCREKDLQQWIEARGFEVDSVQIIHDLVAGVSPAFGYVSLRGRTDETAVIKTLDGQHLNGRQLQVRQDWRHERHCG